MKIHDPETHIIPLAFDAALGRRSELTIIGTDYDTSDGTCVRDYTHGADPADAHVNVLEALFDGAASADYNLRNGVGFSVRGVIDTVERVTGLKVPVVFGPRREGDASTLIADCSKAPAALGWKPRFSDLETIVRTAWDWRQRERLTPKRL